VSVGLVDVVVLVETAVTVRVDTVDVMPERARREERLASSLRLSVVVSAEVVVLLRLKQHFFLTSQLNGHMTRAGWTVACLVE